MLCENCKKNVATTYFKQTVNGKTTEIFLCDECAAKLGLDSGIKSFGLGLSSMLPELFSREKDIAELRCPVCGTLYSSGGKDGMVGCDKCYDTFASRLDPVIKRMHGSRKHVGKTPQSFAAKPEGKLDQLKRELKLAIEKEDFESAAKLRDQIKSMEQQGGVQ